MATCRDIFRHALLDVDGEPVACDFFRRLLSLGAIVTGATFSGAGFQLHMDFPHNGAWGNLDRAKGTFFLGWISKQ